MNKKECPVCRSKHTIKYGVRKGVQLYKCQACGYQFRTEREVSKDELWNAYQQEKQTIEELSKRFGKSISTVKRRLHGIKREWKQPPLSGVGFVHLDVTYWGHNFGVLLTLDNQTGRPLYMSFVKSETVKDYEDAVCRIKERGYAVRGLVIDGKQSLFKTFSEYHIQMCQFHHEFFTNSMVRQLWEQNTDIVLVDTGNSYEGLCDYVNGKYISYTEEHPITMNPFAINREELNIEKIGFLKNLIMLIWKGTNGKITKTEDHLIEDVITEYYDAHFRLGKVKELSFNTFYEYSTKRIPEIVRDNNLEGIDLATYNYLLKDFYKGGNHELTLNENLDTALFDETFIVFEIDSIKDDPLLFPLVTLIIMDVFIQKMRIKKNRKVLVIEEAWKAIASPMMAEYIKYLYKTARKFWASVGVVTQEIQDIVGSPIVKEAIINNSDVIMLLDQSKFKERFDEIKAILGLTEVDCRKIFTINRLENKEGRSFFREVFIRRGQNAAVFGVEEPHECYMTYTTERAEKEALKLYKRELKCSHQQAIEAYCSDWDRSGISKSLPFAQKVNQAGHVLNLQAKK